MPDGPPPPPRSPGDALAALRNAGPRVPGRRKPGAAYSWQRQTESECWVELPAPNLLAEVFAGPVLADGYDLFTYGPAILRRFTGDASDPREESPAVLVQELHAALDALPARPDARDPYTDLRTYLAEGHPGTLAAYLAETVAAVRATAPRWRPTVQRRERRAPMSATARQRVSRERRRAAEVESSRVWLAQWSEDAAPGSRVTAPELYGQAAEGIGYWVDWFKEDRDGYAEEAADMDWPEVPAVPGSRTFYAVADDALGGRRVGTGNVRYYLASAIAAEIHDQADDMHDQEGRAAA